MPDITITIGTSAAQRFGAALDARSRGAYIEATGDTDPSLQDIAEWWFKQKAKKFTFRYEEDQNEYIPDPFDGEQ